MTDADSVQDPVEIAPGVRRLIAPNPSPMTERGTNTYLLGGRVAAVIDPGPDDAAHRARIQQALAGADRVEAVIVTHTHLDHSSGAAALARALDAPLLAFGVHGDGGSETMRRLSDIGGGEGADRNFAPDRRLGDGERIEAPDGAWALTALHTPGHLGNHICLALEGADGGEGVLFSGDHVMAWSTSLVSPPDGDMGAFMASLDRLLERQSETPDRLYLPGHGAPIEDPTARLKELRAHRLGRESQILAALSDAPRDALALVDMIYEGLAPGLRPAAARNVLAHLVDLCERGLAAPEGGVIAADAGYLRAG